MLRYLAVIGALVACAGTAQTSVTSSVRLIDKSPKTPWIIIANAKTTRSVKKGVAVFACEGGPRWRKQEGAVANGSNFASS